MIYKDVDYASAVGKWQGLLEDSSIPAKLRKTGLFHLAGLQAEKDMAYYLNAFFADDDNFAVFHNLKVEHNGLSAQIDHLVLTRWTAYLIESKSISQIITVNEHGEWGRIYNRKFTPMESPVEQSRRHKEILFSFLNANRHEFMGAVLGGLLKKNIKFLTPVHFVAISSKGQIRGDGRNLFPEVKKADQIATAIKSHHDGLDNGLFSTSLKDEDMDAFNAKEFKSVVHFLMQSDVSESPLDMFRKNTASFLSQNLNISEAKPEVSSNGQDTPCVETPVERSIKSQYTCRKCNSENIKIASGRYGYYFKCNDCSGNTPISQQCSQCSTVMKISKSGDEFYINCPKCGSKTLFWKNPPASNKDETKLNSTPASNAPAAIPLCPRCKSEMILRVGKKGEYVGKEFWGCNRYPKCRSMLPKQAD